MQGRPPPARWPTFLRLIHKYLLDIPQFNLIALQIIYQYCYYCHPPSELATGEDFPGGYLCKYDSTGGRAQDSKLTKHSNYTGVTLLRCTISRNMSCQDTRIYYYSVS